MKSLQQQYAPHNKCFGCGPANDKGLQINSFVEDSKLVATFRPQAHHLAFEGMLNGGICGALLDCHSNWTAAYFLMKRLGQDVPPCTVTAEFSVKLLKPTPMDIDLNLEAHVVEISDRKATISASLSAHGVLSATCIGLFVAVKEGHPAFHRW